MNILDQIIACKKVEIHSRKDAVPVEMLKKSAYFSRQGFSMSNALQDSDSGIIAEHKRRSPSRSMINKHSRLQDVVVGYEKAGATAISVLTDITFFGGCLEDLLLARKTVQIPILRKEFIIDPYQVYESKAYGADAILLIAAVLEHEQLNILADLAQALGLEVLLEVHSLDELQRSLLPSINMIGINNRNLKTFDVSLETSKELAPHVPVEFVKVSESGINSEDNVRMLQSCGYQGFLIGGRFMSADDPGKSAEGFIKQLQQ